MVKEDIGAQDKALSLSAIKRMALLNGEPTSRVFHIFIIVNNAAWVSSLLLFKGQVIILFPHQRRLS